MTVGVVEPPALRMGEINLFPPNLCDFVVDFNLSFYPGEFLY